MLKIDNYIEEYGKELICKVLDMAVINKHIDRDVMRELLIEHKIITRNTKHLRVYFSKSALKQDISVSVKNLSGRLVFSLILYDDDMTKMLSTLSAQ